MTDVSRKWLLCFFVFFFALALAHLSPHQRAHTQIGTHTCAHISTNRFRGHALAPDGPLGTAWCGALPTRSFLDRLAC